MAIQLTTINCEIGRGQKQVENVLGENFNGVIISDFLSAYNKIKSLKQRCLVHLLRLLNQFLDHYRADKLRKRILRYYNELTTCLDYFKIDAHNNYAERLLRNNVIMRKITFGNRSDSGILNHQVLLSLIETAKLKALNPLDFLFNLISNPVKAANSIGLSFPDSS